MSNPRLKMVSIVSIWGSPNPYGDTGMEINNASKEEKQHIQRGGKVGRGKMDRDNGKGEEEGGDARTRSDE